MTQVMKVSKITYDVLTTGNANLSFSSELATHSIYNVVDVNKPAGDSSVTYSHNLGYAPKVWIFENDGASSWSRRIPQDWFHSGTSIDYKIDSNDIVIETESSGTEYDFTLVIFTRSPAP